MTSPNYDERVSKKLDELRAARQDVAIARLDNDRKRYPEISHAGVEPLSDEQLIEIAIDVELNRQRGIYASLKEGKR